MIEEPDVEIEEPVDEPTAPSPPPDPNRPTVHDVLVGCLAQRLPCPVCGRIEPCRCVPPEGYSHTHERATLIEKALVLYGHLPEPDSEHVFDEVETAQWLAARSGFARYTQVKDGWKRLLEAEPDVELAAIKALQRVPTGEMEAVKGAKAALLAWHGSKKV